MIVWIKYQFLAKVMIKVVFFKIISSDKKDR